MANCPQCRSTEYEEASDVVQFLYNNRQIAVIVPVMTCWDCGHKWTDERAKEIQYKAILEAT